MYTVNVKVRGVAPLLQHRFPMPNLADMSKGATVRTGAKDYSEEWREYFYTTSDGQIYQPAAHFDGAMGKAAGGFKITGKRGKTYKDLFSASVFVTPDQIPFGVAVPDALDADADKPLYLDMRPVVVNRARVVRIRPTFKAGWELAFSIECIDDQIASELLLDVLTYAGRCVGIGDYRPKFGRFQVVSFEKA